MIIFDKNHVAVTNITNDISRSFIPKFQSIDFKVSGVKNAVFIQSHNTAVGSVTGLLIGKTDDNVITYHILVYNSDNYRVMYMTKLSAERIGYITEHDNLDGLIVASIEKHDKTVLGAFTRFTRQSNVLFTDCYKTEDILEFLAEAEKAKECDISITYGK